LNRKNRPSAGAQAEAYATMVRRSLNAVTTSATPEAPEEVMIRAKAASQARSSFGSPISGC